MRYRLTRMEKTGMGNEELGMRNEEWRLKSLRISMINKPL